MKRSASQTTVSDSSYVSSKAIIVGTLIALAVTLVLVPFGNAIGLSVSVPIRQDNVGMVVLVVGLWILWVQLLSSIIGGYFAGRTVDPIGGSDHEVEFRDGVHGLVAWALSTVLVFAGAALATALTAIVTDNPDNTHTVVTGLSKKATVIFGFVTAASSVVSATAAWWMAVLAGEHRDESVDFSEKIAFRKKSRR